MLATAIRTVHCLTLPVERARSIGDNVFIKDLSEFRLSDAACSVDLSPRAECAFYLTEDLDATVSVCIQCGFGRRHDRATKWVL